MKKHEETMNIEYSQADIHKKNNENIKPFDIPEKVRGS